MQSKLNPYLGFRGTTRQVLEFYHQVFGGKLEMNTYKESHASQDPSQDEWIMHGSLIADNGITIMSADVPPTMQYNENGNISMSLSGDNEEELRGYWDKLAEGAQINIPFEKAPWGDTFGMLTDQFGIKWMVNIAGKKS